MIYVIYLFALIGLLCTGFAALIFTGLCWSKWMAKQKRLLDARVDAQRRAQS